MPAGTLPRILRSGKVGTCAIELAGPDGDIFSLIGIAAGAMLDAGGNCFEVSKMKAAALGADSYEAALTAVATWAPIYFLKQGRTYTPRSN